MAALVEMFLGNQHGYKNLQSLNNGLTSLTDDEV
jgi:hypothetical protein